MKKVKGIPITGAQPEYSKKRPFVPDAKETSADAQTMIAEAPSPFKNRNQTGEMPAGTGSNASGFTPQGGQSGNRAPMNPPVGAVGQSRMPNQAPQIGGRNGFPPPKRRAGVNGQGFPSKRNARFYGE